MNRAPPPGWGVGGWYGCIDCQPYAPAAFTTRKYSWYSFLLGSKHVENYNKLLYNVTVLEYSRTRLYGQQKIKWSGSCFHRSKNKTSNPGIRIYDVGIVRVTVNRSKCRRAVSVRNTLCTPLMQPETHNNMRYLVGFQFCENN